MRDNFWLFPLLLGMASVPFACSDSETTASTGTDPGAPCERSSECDDNDPCTFDHCTLVGDGKFCRNEPAGNGPQDSELQTDGDCQELRCEDGESVVVNDDEDTVDDDNDQDCMVPSCDNGTPVTAPADEGDFCRVTDSLGGACDAMGSCSCAPSSPGVTVYVDAENGIDSPNNGSGRGGCAYATLDYALMQSDGEIVLTDDLYDSGNAGFPITLTGNQQLRCDYDFDNDQHATTITGSGTFGVGTATIVMTGINQVVRCLVDGGGMADTAVVIDAAGDLDAEQYQELRVNRITGATNGVEATANGDIIYLYQNQITTNTTTGLLFTGADKTGYLQENNFSANATDVICSDANPELFGDSNGGPSCTGCDNCPF